MACRRSTHGFGSDGTDDPDAETRDVLLGRLFPRRAQVIDTATFRTLLRGTLPVLEQAAGAKVTGVARGGF